MPPPSTPWNPSKGVSLLIGLATLWPPIYLVLFLSTIGFLFVEHGNQAGFGWFKYIFPLHCLTMLLSFGLTAVYIVHAFKTDRFAPDKRVLWVIILFMGNMLAFPIYWWLYLRPGAAPPDAAA